MNNNETKRSRFDVIPTFAPAHVAKALNLAEGQPVLKICRGIYKQDGELMDCELDYWRPDPVMIHIDSIGYHFPGFRLRKKKRADTKTPTGSAGVFWFKG